MGRLGDHPHIVTVFDVGDEGGAPYIVSQYMGGGSVEDLLAKRGAASAAARARDAHRRAGVRSRSRTRTGAAIVHRDVKPGNVWLAADGSAALGDFGLAIALDRSRMTMAGMMVGTVAYMAPEQALGRTPDARSDLYALGCDALRDGLRAPAVPRRRCRRRHLAAHQHRAGRAGLAQPRARHARSMR